ncbi:MAG: VCBS repeat-containing protein [Bernardetiaceae bacterium]|nr:VCBS repeat-containing protein [Bernardetiaceae bacterium]
MACQNASPQFNLLPAEETGIRFANRITESDTFNILDFEYVYNGGGVGVGDFDGNGLPDLYFTGNMVANELYLNQGDFKFKEVALEAGVAGRRRWCSGVAVVDINADGRPDLYVSATVHQDPARRANQLFINQGPEKGIPRFKEMAAEYGLADTTHTTNTAFFDYDNDGDLDAYVLVNQMTGTTYPNKYRPKVTDGTAPTNDRLYRNDWDSLKGHPVFTNVSQAAGIRYEGFGLGLHLGDLNRDGWKDIYVTNDYLNNDLLYLNQGNGTFINVADTAFKHTCYSAMGNDVADLNNDGLADIVALDMMPEYNRRKKMMLAANNYNHYVNNEKFGYQHQYVRNVLQLNQGNLPGKNYPGFSDIGLLAGVAETDWSWAPLAADFDNDGWRDLFITNGFPKDITDRDFVIYRGQMSHLATKEMLLEAIPRVKLPNYAYRNRGDLTFEDMTQAWGFATPSFSNGAAYADLDNDGDLDYVVNNIDDSAHVYRNFLRERQPEASNFLRIKFAGPGQNRAGLGAIVEFSLSEGQKVVYEHTPYRGYLSSVEAVAHFGLGRQTQVAQLRVIWPNGTQQVLRNVAANQVLTVSAGQATERYQPAATAGVPAFTEVGDSLGLQVVHQEWDAIDFNLQKLLPHKFTQFGPALAVGDVNQDGRDDLFMGGGNYHKGRWFLQGPNGRFMERDLLPGAANDKTSEDLGALLFDADGDQDLDLYLVSGGYDGQPGHASYRDRFYENQGGTFTARPEALPDLFTSGASVKAADFDRDGDLDLFVGGRVVPGQYPKPAASHLLRNDSRPGAPQFTEVTAQVAPALQAPGLVCDALWTDYDRDGWPDLLLAGEFMPLTFYQNQKGKLVPAPASPELASKVGWWNSLAAGDFDNDGDTDYVAGNLGLNSLNRASPAQPVRVYAGDFDKDGLYDALPFAFFRGENGQRQEFPFFGREEHIKQMVSYRMKFPGFAPFAEAGPAQLLTDEQRQAALVCEANYFASVYVENLGKGQFKVRALPTMAQLAPVFGLLPFDADADAHLDLLLVGNDYGTEVMQGRLDALNGLVLQGDGRGNFTPLSLGASGFYVPGDAKALVQITDYQGRALVVASQNRGPLRVFRPRQAGQVVPFQPTNLAATLRWPSGASRRVEAYWGSGFLGQSARGVVVPPGAALAPALGQ